MKKTLLALGVLLAAFVPALHAQNPGLLLGPISFSPQTGNFGTLGTSFTVNPGYMFTVSHVGYWDNNANGITGQSTPISVALFNNSTQQIISGTQIDFLGTAGAPFTAPVSSGVYRLSALSTPIVLGAGSYTIAEWNYDLSGASQDIIGNRGGGNTFNTYGGALTLNGTTGVSDGTTNGAFPGAFNSGGADFFAGNFYGTADTAPIPEPSTYAAICAGFALVIAGAQRRRRRPVAA